MAIFNPCPKIPPSSISIIVSGNALFQPRLLEADAKGLVDYIMIAPSFSKYSFTFLYRGWLRPIGISPLGPHVLFGG